MTKSQRMPQAQRRDQLVAVATEVFSRSGYRTASMDAVAIAAGVSKPVLYQHFDSKQSLYLAVIDAANAVFDSVLTEALHSSDDNEERVAAAISAYFSFVTDHRSEFLIIARADSYEPGAVKRASSSTDRAAMWIAELIERESAATTAEAKLLAVAITSMAEAAALQLAETAEFEADAAAHLISGVLWNGVGSLSDSEEAEAGGGSAAPVPAD
ncbi:TetR/AcrR family transcriptional regulator [Brevibacterium sp. NPDC049920]|nr:TetR/AcrR family transcriptional regulator [uncultured Brevibacterium sp.]